MAIFGSSNLSDSGDLLIFNKVSYKTLLMFEKELGRDRMTYLVEEGLPPDTATASHLESTKADGILFQAGGSDPVALRSAIMERINEGRRVVFLPGPVSHVKGSISQIPPRVIKALEALIYQAIATFEPRILRHTLRVKARVGHGEMNHNALSFEIEGDLWAQPVPLRLLLQTDLDLESGHVRVVNADQRRRP